MAKRTTETLRRENDLLEQEIRSARLKATKAAMRSVLKATQGAGRTRVDRYDNATRTRLRPGPRAAGGSADKHLSASTRRALTRDCQDLRRNNSIARIVIARAVQFINGDGPIFKASTPDKVWNALADRYFRMWWEALDPDFFGHVDIREQNSGPELFNNLISGWCTDGDGLFLLTTRGSLQYIESERVVSPGGPTALPIRLPNGRTIVDGVEIDQWGAPVRYHVSDWDERGNLKPSPRPVSAEFAALITSPFAYVAGLTRGEPALQAVIGRLERLDSYDESTAIAAENATLLSAIVEATDPASMQQQWEAGVEDQPDRANAAAPKTVAIERGMIQFIEKGGSVKQIDPKFPTSNYRDYVLWHMMVIGAELGVPVAVSLYDASGLSWSNIKALMSLSMRSIEPAQARLERLFRWIRNWKVREWMDSGMLPARDDYAACTVAFPRPPVLDFESEVKGLVLAINNRLMTRGMATELLGTGVFTELAATCGSEEKLLNDLGIPAIADPGAGAPIEPTTPAATGTGA